MAVSWTPKSAYTPETFQKKGRVTIMTKKKLFKMLTLALALVMLFSVTAFAGSVSWTADGGASATGTCNYQSSSTSVSTPMYISVDVTFGYLNTDGYYTGSFSHADNAGSSVHAFVYTPSDFKTHVNTSASHTAGSTSNMSYY